jgi:hypothetical protein
VEVKKKSFVVFKYSLTGYYHIFISLNAGQAHNIVVAERVVLNFMQRMSGIATLTKVSFFLEFGNRIK